MPAGTRRPESDNAHTGPYVKRLKAHSTLRSVLTLAGGTALSQGLIVLASPLLTRLYSPASFGAFTVFVSLLSVLSCVATLRYELAIPLPKDDDEALTTCILSGAVTLFYTAATAVPLLFFSTAIAELAGVPEIAPYLWLLPIGILGVGFYQSLYYWAVRCGEYPTISRTRISQSLAMVVIQVSASFAGIAGLIFGQVISRYVGISSLARSRPSGTVIRAASSLPALREQAFRYKSFPLWSAPGTLLNTVGAQAPMLAFAALFSSHIAGLYALTHRVLSIPITLIGTAMADVFFSNASDAHRDGRLGHITGNLLDKLVTFGLPIAVALMLAGPDLFLIVFGPEWVEAGTLTTYATPWLFMALLASPVSRVFLVAARQKELFALQVLQPCLGILVIAIATAFRWEFLPTFILFSAVYTIFYALYLWRSLSIAAARLTDRVWPALRVGGITALTTGLPYTFFSSMLPYEGQAHALLSLGLCLVLTLACYGVLLLSLRSSKRSD